VVVKHNWNDRTGVKLTRGRILIAGAELGNVPILVYPDGRTEIPLKIISKDDRKVRV
jgi:hypothetical protein